jgi:hypothetical protein
MSEADLHALSGALAFGGTETLGAGAFRGISRSASEVAGLEREEENNNSSSSNNKKNKYYYWVYNPENSFGMWDRLRTFEPAGSLDFGTWMYMVHVGAFGVP